MMRREEKSFHLKTLFHLAVARDIKLQKNEIWPAKLVLWC